MSAKPMPYPEAASEKVRFVVRRKLLRGFSGERNEDNQSADGLAGRHDSRLRHAKQAAKLLRGLYLSL